ncbi:carbohydrate kinase family protein [Lentzea pudingi]|nr:carbohydrate kinase family protein [Lentzea pudingi]
MVTTASATRTVDTTGVDAMPRIAVAGIVNVRLAVPVDVFPIPLTSSRRLPGQIALRLSGVGWTIANTLQALGSDVLFATYIGRDPAGQLAEAGLRSAGLLGPATQVCDAQPRAVVHYDRAGTRSGATDLRDAVNRRYPTEVFTHALDAAGGADFAMLSNINFTRSLISAAADRAIPIITDLHVIDTVQSRHNEEWMRVAHVLSCSHEKMPCPPGDWIRRLWSRYRTPVVIVGMGAAGALIGLHHHRAVWHVPAAASRLVRYTSGAGDTLLATFAHHYALTGDPIDALPHGCLAAGWKVGAGPDDDVRDAGTMLPHLVHSQGLPAVHRV